MEITVTPVKAESRKPPPGESALGFGNYFTDHMFMVNYTHEKGWHDPRVVPYEPLSLDPAALVLHYNQEVFEGLKAYRQENGGIALFRPEQNIARMNRSAQRMLMPEMDPALFMKALEALVLIDKEWIPRSSGTSLYIRPVMIATEPAVGVRASSEYLFYIIASPVGAYYPEGFYPTRIWVSDHHVRAAKGGSGEAKTSGNYGPTLIVSHRAVEKGYHQVLWLDAKENRYVEEVGTSNIFFLMDDQLVTPPLEGTILPGITRDSVIRMAKKWNIPVSERPVAIDEVVDGCANGKIKEIFAAGTAAVISPIGTLGYKGEDIQVAGGSVGELSKKLYDEITGIQYGRCDDPFGWRVVIG